MTITEFLKDKVPFLAGLSQEEAHELASACEQVHYAPGQTILMRGTTVDGLHVIAEGRVSVEVKKGKAPPEKVAELGPGKVFGETSILEQSVAGATIKAVEDSLVFVIPQEAFLGILERNPSVKKVLLDKIAARKAASAERLAGQ